MKHVCFVLLAVTPAAWGMPDSVASLLQRHARFTPSEIARVRSGERVVRMIDTGNRSEVSFAAVSRLPVTASIYLDRARNGTLYKPRDPLLHVGKFSDSPSLREANPVAEDAPAMLAAMAAYRKKGQISFGTANKAVDVNAEFVPLAQQAGYLRELMPAAYQHLLRHEPGNGDYFLWKQLTFGFRPVTRVAHVSVWERAPGEGIVLMKQIYANRYFHSSFQVDHVIADGDELYLITLNFGKSEWLEGVTGRLIRPVVLSRTQAMAEKTIDAAKRDFLEERRSL